MRIGGARNVPNSRDKGIGFNGSIRKGIVAVLFYSRASGLLSNLPKGVSEIWFCEPISRWGADRMCMYITPHPPPERVLEEASLHALQLRQLAILYTYTYTYAYIDMYVHI